MTAAATHEPAAAVPPKRRSPYQGLVPYTEADAAYFFGRDGWREVVTDHLLAYRLSLFYGASGVGKSSILRAGVGYHTREQARKSFADTGKTELAIVEFSTWQQDALSGLEDAVATSVARISPKLAERPPTGSLANVLKEWSRRIVRASEDEPPEVEGLLLVVLDQFEEYFVYNRRDAGRTSFAAELAEAIERTDVPVNFLISIREDALDKLDRFDREISGVFDNLLRCERLDRHAAEEAIRKPVEKWSELEGEQVGIEDELVDSVLDQMPTVRERTGETGEGTLGEDDDEHFFEAPYLQLVMTRIWEEERAQGSNELRAATLAKLGGAERIVQRHFDDTMRALPSRERQVAAGTLKYLVTPNGTKIALPANALARWTKRDEAQVEGVLEKLAAGDRRILRVVPSQGDEPPSYEIFHDRLAPGVLNYVSRAKQRRRRRLGALVGAGIILAVLAGVLTPLLYYAHQNSEKLARLQKLNVPFLKAILEGHGAEVVGAGFSPDGRDVLTASNDFTARLWRASTGKELETFNADGPVSSAVFSPVGHRILITGRSTTVWGADGLRFRRFSGIPHPTFATFVPNSDRTFVVVGDGTAIVDPEAKPQEPVQKIAHARVAALNPQVFWLAVADDAGNVRLWNHGGGFFLGPPRHLAGTTSLAWRPDGRVLASVGRDGRVAVASLAGPSNTTALSPFSVVGRVGFSLSAVQFSPDGRTLLTSGSGATAQLWSVASRRLLAVLRCSKGPVVASFSPDGKLVATGSGDDLVRVWDARSYKQIAELKGHSGPIRSVAFSPDGRSIVSASDDQTARVWSTPGRADLALSLGLVTVSAGISPEVVVVKGQVLNDGVAAAPATTVIATVTARGRRVRSQPGGIPPLDPGERTVFALRVPLGDIGAGAAQLTVRVDPTNAILEQSSANNAKSTSIDVPEGTRTVTAPIAPPPPTPTSATTVTVVAATTVTVPAVTVTVSTPATVP